MSFKIASSPHQHNQRSTAQIMRMVVLACLPGIALQAVLFGYGVLLQLALAILTAWCSEALVLKLRGKAVLPRLKDHSALLTAVLLAIAIPPYAPWWLIVIGTAFAIIMVKQLYGGLGQNLFNPAMAAYVLLLVSFPLQMTQWLPPLSLQSIELAPWDAVCAVFSQYSCSGFSLTQLQSSIDGVTMATPLDTLRTGLSRGLTLEESLQSPVFFAFAGAGWLWLNLAYLAGGLLLIQQKIISWRIPVAVLGSLFVLSAIAALAAPDSLAGPLFHLFSGGTMLAAFFIATDPVSASTTDKGRLCYGALIGLLVFLIRNFGGYPDAYAFAILLANMAVPLIDYYTRPRTYGHRPRSELK
ncbi:electron transport complex subunit RsxD [Rheinheimera sp. NSM]|uniref:electron transport complex subunit RsxD n=1 Tax=Rheinheimera sp. NSM TaxID=3457884 RepID=UPI0040350EEC